MKLLKKKKGKSPARMYQQECCMSDTGGSYSGLCGDEDKRIVSFCTLPIKKPVDKIESLQTSSKTDERFRKPDLYEERLKGLA